MNFLNNDFETSTDTKGSGVEDLREYYLSTLATPASSVHQKDGTDQCDAESDNGIQGTAGPLLTLFWNTMVLSERSARNYSRNLLAYGVRAGMYGGNQLLLLRYVQYAHRCCT